jgi:transposase
METLRMSQGERRRLVVMSQVASGKLVLRQASELLSVSYRQAKRIWCRYQAEGDGGVVHRLRGRPSNHRSPAELRERVLARYREAYHDYGPTLAAECLAEEGLAMGIETLRQWLRGAGLWAPQRQRRAHRRRRARKEHWGELVQMDGSHHDWFEGRRCWAVLMVMIDDATGRIDARFFEGETLAAAFTMFGEYAVKYGLPQAIYVDRAGVYRSDREPTEAEILAGKEPQTEFGRAMEEVGVKLILARSPQAKGRVERMNRTLQDRLVKALRRRGISDLETANRFLEEEFLEPFNARFGVTPAAAENVHRAVPAELDWGRVLSVQEERVVQNDWTVRWNNAFLQLPRVCSGAAGVAVVPGVRVQVCEQLDGRVRVFAGEHELNWSTTRSEPRRPRKPVVRRVGPTKSSQGQKPAASHPWRGLQRSGEGSEARGGVASGVGAVCSASVAALPALRKPPPPR